ncbi:terminase large subunit domain-containing protein [Bradyrhizobium liaoningense]|uniref:terminase large subunit domain-containing protein n=1 Tax=Bradyrhizobium liaoningense TaxID=43992 RepID=UPI0005524673|nr:terminase large subunit [Bradyrhizobium liaoningense]
MSIETLPRFACPDWWERIQAGQIPMADVPLNQAKAAKALAFFNRLRLPDVPGTPSMAEACGDWFKAILCAFLASEDPATKRRLVWELLCMVPKKNSKTTYVAALGLTALFLEEAPNRQMLIVAPSQNISERCFEQGQGMIRLDKKLDAIFKVQDHLKCITRRKTGTQLDVKTFDTSIVTGEIPILTIIDELHELGKKAKAAAVMQQIRGGGITMQGGQVLMITTQSDEAPAGIWRTELKKARAIRDGKGGPNPILLPVLYEYPHELQKDQDYWRAVDNWSLLLPNLGRSIDPQRLLEDYQNNGRVNEEAEQIWASQHLNIEIGVGLGADGWRGADFWEAAADKTLTLDSLLARCEVVTIGADGGGLDDLLGLAVIGRDRETREWLSWCHAFADPKVLERRKEIAPLLKDFAEEGSLTIGDGAARHKRFVELVAQVRASGLLPQKDAVGVDPNNAAAVFEALAEGGVAPEQIRRLMQGPALAPAMYGLELKLDDGTFWHADQLLMAWVMGNAKVEQKGNHLLITKQISGRAKIDPLIALFEAAILMSWNPQGVMDISDFLKNAVMAG